jgi:hypothetical protein
MGLWGQSRERGFHADGCFRVARVTGNYVIQPAELGIAYPPALALASPIKKNTGLPYRPFHVIIL